MAGTRFINAKAEEDENLELVAEAVKYYKTTSILSNSIIQRNANMGEMNSITVEITKEEYDSWRYNYPESIK